MLLCQSLSSVGSANLEAASWICKATGFAEARIKQQLACQPAGRTRTIGVRAARCAIGEARFLQRATRLGGPDERVRAARLDHAPETSFGPQPLQTYHHRALINNTFRSLIAAARIGRGASADWQASSWQDD